jgi:hypothetical protein
MHQSALQLIWHPYKSNNPIIWNITLPMFSHHTSQTFNLYNFCFFLYVFINKISIFSRNHNKRSKIRQCHNLHAASSSNNIKLLVYTKKWPTCSTFSHVYKTTHITKTFQGIPNFRWSWWDLLILHMCAQTFSQIVGQGWSLTCSNT